LLRALRNPTTSNVGLNAVEQRSMFALWSLVAAPLLAGTDLVHASNETLAILNWGEAIAVNKDVGVGGQVQGRLVRSSAWDLSSSAADGTDGGERARAQAQAQALALAQAQEQAPLQAPQLEELQLDWDAVDGGSEVWAKNMSDGSVAVILLNLDGSNATAITADWADLGLPAAEPRSVRDLWAKKDLGDHAGSFTAAVEPHGALMARLAKKGASAP
jgi:alpha-galactosidase